MGHSISYAIRMCCRAEIELFRLRLIFLPHWPNSKYLVSPKDLTEVTFKSNDAQLCTFDISQLTPYSIQICGISLPGNSWELRELPGSILRMTFWLSAGLFEYPELYWSFDKLR